jgi:hypothetical protein
MTCAALAATTCDAYAGLDPVRRDVAQIFGDPDFEVCRFRHMTWKLGGLMDRQSLSASTAESKSRLAAEKLQIDQLNAELKANSIFKALANGAQRVVLKGDWKTGRSWRRWRWQLVGAKPTCETSILTFAGTRTAAMRRRCRSVRQTIWRNSPVCRHRCSASCAFEWRVSRRSMQRCARPPGQF